MLVKSWQWNVEIASFGVAEETAQMHSGSGLLKTLHCGPSVRLHNQISRKFAQEQLLDSFVREPCGAYLAGLGAIGA